MAQEKKTNAMRILEHEGVAFNIVNYEFDSNHLDALSAAQKTGIPAGQIFKTIVMRNSVNEIFVFCVPADTEVNLKYVRALTYSKDIQPVRPSELLALTGYIRGCCSPLGMKKHYKTFIDETAELYENISISAGLQGIQILVEPQALARIIPATFAQLTL